MVWGSSLDQRFPEIRALHGGANSVLGPVSPSCPAILGQQCRNSRREGPRGWGRMDRSQACWARLHLLMRAPVACTLKSEALGSGPTALKVPRTEEGRERAKPCQLRSGPCWLLASLAHSLLCCRLLNLVFPKGRIGCDGIGHSLIFSRSLIFTPRGARSPPPPPLHRPVPRPGLHSSPTAGGCAGTGTAVTTRCSAPRRSTTTGSWCTW